MPPLSLTKKGLFFPECYWKVSLNIGHTLKSLASELGLLGTVTIDPEFARPALVPDLLSELLACSNIGTIYGKAS